MRSAKTMTTLIEHCLPGITRREWGAIAAARRAGLPEPGISSLRRHLEDEFALRRDSA